MTRQITDVLLVEDQKYYLNEELLEEYFRQFPARRPAFPIHCTALWRGYVATFEINKGAFLLRELDTLRGMKQELSAQDVGLAEALVGQKCTWYSGLIRIDEFRGQFDAEPPNGLFEYLEIRAGDFIQKRVMTFQQLQAFKEEQYGYFLLSGEAEKIYDLFGRNVEQGTLNLEAVNEIIREHIMTYLREVY